MKLATKKSSRYRQMAEINVVPYIDVMLVLLIIFMVTAPLLTQGVKVDLPKAASQTIDSKSKEPLIVSVDVAGNYYLNIAANPNQPIDEQTLFTRVSSELQASANVDSAIQRQVLVKGDRNVNYGKVVTAMVLLQEAGAKTVGLVTDGKKTINH